MIKQDWPMLATGWALVVAGLVTNGHLSIAFGLCALVFWLSWSVWLLVDACRP